jgi:hypothetical protein
MTNDRKSEMKKMSDRSWIPPDLSLWTNDSHKTSFKVGSEEKWSVGESESESESGLLL